MDRQSIKIYIYKNNPPSTVAANDFCKHLWLFAITCKTPKKRHSSVFQLHQVHQGWRFSTLTREQAGLRSEPVGSPREQAPPMAGVHPEHTPRRSHICKNENQICKDAKKREDRGQAGEMRTAETLSKQETIELRRAWYRSCIYKSIL